MRSLTLDSLNPGLRKVEYAVRGELAIKAEILREELKKPNHNLPFDKVISSNIGNPQQKGLDQPPITFNRQVCISIVSDQNINQIFFLGCCSDGVARPG
jgi:alanine transaminase